MHQLQCKCGTLRGQLEGAGTANRLICYCTDCRAFARYLGHATDVLDESGGTEIVQVAQPRLRFAQGTENLAAIRLSATGMVRWYASCCNTPIGNTMANPKISFIGLIHSCLDRESVDRDFGPSVALLNTASALGDRKPAQRGLPGAIARFLWIVATARLSGKYKRTQLFTDSGLPRVPPLVLTPPQLESLKRAI